MRRLALCLLALLALSGLGFAPNPVVPRNPPPVQVWQVKGIVAALKDTTPGVREKAIRKLAELCGYFSSPGHWPDDSLRLAKEQLPPLLMPLKAEDIEMAQAWALFALGTVGTEKDLPTLTAYLNDQRPLMRSSAVKALSRLGTRDHTDQVFPLLKDSDPRVTLAAVEALGRMNAVKLVE